MLYQEHQATLARCAKLENSLKAMKTAVQQVLYPKSKRYDAEFDNSISARTTRHHRSGLDERHRYDNIQLDRKSVVSGTSVSVSVDLGGRRIIKKQTKPKKNTIAKQ